MKLLLGLLVAVASAAPAFAVPISSVPPRPAPAPDLAIGMPALLAVIGAYVIARLLVRPRVLRKAEIS